MRDRELTEMHTVEVEHWWYKGKRILFRRLLANRLAARDLSILDVGAGTGAVAEDFGRDGWICATDLSSTAMSYASGRGVEAVAVADAESLPFESAQFDLVLAFDIIEHVDDPAAMLAELARVVRPGGAVAIHVPAWPSLWSHHDEILHHKLRFTRKGLAETVAAAGLEAEYLGWSSMAIFVPAFMLRWAQRLIRVGTTSQDEYSLPGPLNSVLVAIYRIEAWLAARWGLPVGVSLAAVARVPDGVA